MKQKSTFENNILVMYYTSILVIFGVLFMVVMAIPIPRKMTKLIEIIEKRFRKYIKIDEKLAEKEAIGDCCKEMFKIKCLCCNEKVESLNIHLTIGCPNKSKFSKDEQKN